MKDHRLHVALVWHMHQPDYRDPITDRALMPWTWLHAVKDYGEMLRIVEQTPGACATFNLVPTLLEQLAAYRDGHQSDEWLELAAADPAWLSSAQRQQLLRDFFSVYPERHVHPWPRYRELAERRNAGVGADGFGDQELRDLQVWFLLSWTGAGLRQEQPLLATLMARGRDFSETDKRALLDVCRTEVAGILERYHRLEAEGRIELALTPYAHPILPLLIDTDIAHQASTGEPLPEPPLRAPGDARHQVQQAHAVAAALLDARPRGMWPAEGAVSEPALRLLRDSGALWAASDEGILAKSLDGGLHDRRRLYRPYSFDGLPLVFRDRELSDRIGFLYADWEPQVAVDDLVQRLETVAEQNAGGLASLILDGENCWERYRDNGRPFLTALYRRLLDSPHLHLVTVSQGLAVVPTVPLRHVAPGSWINSDFGIWIGHTEENTAWGMLRQAHADLTATEPAAATDTPSAARWHLLRAEGSDWFWWLGDDHSTEQAAIFDQLFRRHLQAAYRTAGLDVPPALLHSVRREDRRQPLSAPQGHIRPALDGRGGFLGWRGAGRIDLAQAGAMHSGQKGFSTLLYGSDGERLVLRLDPDPGHRLEDLLRHRIEIRLTADTPWIIRLDTGGVPPQLLRQGRARLVATGDQATGRHLELAVPLAPLKLEQPGTLTLSVHLLDAQRELARWPAEGGAQAPWPGEPAVAPWLI